ncbi:kinase-like domain-containing protein [Xylariomycetidae sp. FL2044]|nr:kinase-like domain-containing protein [Xylariomycetidae sp. FL2044]
MQTLCKDQADNQVRMIHKLSHTHLIGVQDIFGYRNSYYIAFEFMPLSLSELAGNPLIDEPRLASILGQVLDGLAYLESKGLEHGKLTCSNILINLAGEVKIWAFEGSRTISGANADVRALSDVVMELMQGYVKEQGAVGVDDLERWPSDSHAVNFLSATTYASEIGELIRHPLFQLPWCQKRLRGVVSLANICTRRGIKFAALTR